MGNHWNYHFTRRLSNHTDATEPDRRLSNILKTGKLLAGNQKGIFYHLQDTPHSVSFTRLPLEQFRYDESCRKRTMVDVHSCFGVALEKGSLPFREVSYVTPQERAIKGMPDEAWAVDSVTPAYDFSWTQEQRALATDYLLLPGNQRVPINPTVPPLERTRACLPFIDLPSLSFVLVATEDDRKRYNQEHGVEAYPVLSQLNRISDYWRSRRTLPPLEDKLHTMWQQLETEGKSTDAGSGNFFMEEALDRTWQVLTQVA